MKRISFSEMLNRPETVIHIDGHDCNGCENVINIDWETFSCPHRGTATCKQLKEQKRPKPLPEPALTYRTEDSVHPDQIRVSFSDGSTAIYDLRTELPHPAMMKNHEIMAKWSNKGYNNQPTRRRRRKP